MFKKGYITLLLSLLLHVVIVLLLNNLQTIKVPNTKTKPTAIKSYIYHPPVRKIKQIKEQIVQPEIAITKIEETKKIQTPPKVEETPLQPKRKQSESKVAVKAPVKKSPSVSKHVKTTLNKPQTLSYKSLNKLRQQIQQNNFESITKDRLKPNTGSIMHGTPTLVPHSIIPLSNEDKQKQATLSMSADKSIIKGDDGNCSLVEDLSVVGIPGVTAVSSFSCGESKHDKSFRKHMNKVIKKLGKE